eukprot:5784188-Karenia_brevis.AAC.1
MIISGSKQIYMWKCLVMVDTVGYGQRYGNKINAVRCSIGSDKCFMVVVNFGKCGWKTQRVGKEDLM